MLDSWLVDQEKGRKLEGAGYVDKTSLRCDSSYVTELTLFISRVVSVEAHENVS